MIGVLLVIAQLAQAQQPPRDTRPAPSRSTASIVGLITSDEPQPVPLRRARVTLKDLSTKKNVEYSIVGSAEADPRNHRLSNESPVGKAVLGRKKGEKVTVPTPRGPVEFQIMKIQPGLAH